MMNEFRLTPNRGSHNLRKNEISKWNNYEKKKNDNHLG